MVPLAVVSVAAVRRGGWSSVDITSTLRELMLDPLPQLAVRFESPVGKPLAPSQFLRAESDQPQAFLVVFTEDSDENQVDEHGRIPPPAAPLHTHALVQEMRHRITIEEEEDNIPQIIPNLNWKLPSNQSEFRTTADELSGTSPTQSTDRTDNTVIHEEFSTSRGKPLRRKRSVLDNQLLDDNDLIDVRVSKPLPQSRVEATRVTGNSDKMIRKGKKGKRKKGKKQQHLPAAPADSWQDVYRSPEGGACSVQKMSVNFAEIGWGRWIISPDKFDANYCSGSCRYPLTKTTDLKLPQAQKPSNHATLQSLVHALGHHPLVPAPACVPHHMSAVTLLYFDEALNVVLKNYPSMVVESCACR